MYLVDDLNIRLDRADDVNAVSLVDLLISYGFNNRVTVPTHRLGGTFDVAATRQDPTAPNVEIVDIGLSDHSLLQWSASSARPTPVVVKTFVRRLWRSLDINDFRSAVLSAVCLPNGLHCLDPDMMGVTSRHQAECHPRPCHPSAYTHPPPTRSFLHSSIVAFSQFSMPQPG